MSAPVANIRPHPDKVIVDDVTLHGCAGRLGQAAAGAVEPHGTMAPGTALFTPRAIEAHRDTVARGQRSHALRMKIARVGDKRFTTNDHDAKKRSIAHGISARIHGGKTFSGVVAQYPTGQKPCRSMHLPVCM
ncbi:hypothetical protein LMG6871_00769 [Ralstonia edaphis]|uniref:2-methylcitrate dehydratase n=1 Tax=Ralstonia edaphi TaxID=3058599 RepID=UPI0028F6AC1E|nr:2-methylcitrate dehydratase [Ralstonia sp. LMG 6871]CAJ0713442.1 hypothetical protein LMG6871_00769 [Ralstonia sp. LMG 6871]